MYGRVVEVGRETNGDTVKGTCASRGWEPGRWSVVYPIGALEENERLSCIFADLIRNTVDAGKFWIVERAFKDSNS